jgi:hypothetical protein
MGPPARALARRGEKGTEGHEQRAEAARRVEQRGGGRGHGGRVQQRPPEVGAEPAEAEGERGARRPLGLGERRARPREGEAEGAGERRELRGLGPGHDERSSDGRTRARAVAPTWAAAKKR